MVSFASRSRIGKLTGAFGSATLAKARRRSWILPVGLAVVLLGMGLWTRTTMETAIRADLRDGLENILARRRGPLG